MSLGEQDLIVLMKILVDNIGERSKDHNMDVTKHVAQGQLTVHLDVLVSDILKF